MINRASRPADRGAEAEHQALLRAADEFEPFVAVHSADPKFAVERSGDLHYAFAVHQTEEKLGLLAVAYMPSLGLAVEWHGEEAKENSDGSAEVVAAGCESYQYDAQGRHLNQLWPNEQIPPVAFLRYRFAKQWLSGIMNDDRFDLRRQVVGEALEGFMRRGHRLVEPTIQQIASIAFKAELQRAAS